MQVQPRESEVLLDDCGTIPPRLLSWANEEHLRILLSGVEAWNEWRLSHPDLTDAELAGKDLTRVNFAHTLLGGANLIGACLMEARLTPRVNLSGTPSDAQTCGAPISKARSFIPRIYRKRTFTKQFSSQR
jgi:uncharacterized protein YjbI with pentapeptide repeats